MARFNFREVQDRFSHVDARFVSSQYNLQEETASYEVSLYPWWEHPLFIKARKRGKSWGYGGIPEEAHKSVTVHAIGLLEARLRRNFDIEEWWFTQDDPRLWRFEDAEQIFCNEPMDLKGWFEVLEGAKSDLGLHELTPLLQYGSIEQVARHGQYLSFSFGRFPRPMFRALRKQLESREIEFVVRREPVVKELPVLFTADWQDYLIAKDFELEVPEWEHREEWFRPS